MIVAINIGLLTAARQEEAGSLFSLLIQQHPEHQFIFISNDKLAAVPVEAKNSSLLVIPGSLKSSIGINLWFNYRLTAVLKKVKADILINATGIHSLRTKIPQLSLLNQSAFLQKPLRKLDKESRYLKKHFASFIKKPGKIILPSEYAYETISKYHPAAAGKLSVIQPGIDEHFKVFAWEEKEACLQQLTAGKEYFLFMGSLDDAQQGINLLKAFSLFKKRQKSNMQLLMVSPVNAAPAFTESLKTYKYREEMQVLVNPSKTELAKIIASAYAMVCPATAMDFDARALQAMHCAVPVIAFESETLAGLLGDAALYVNPADPQQTANAMMLLFKDENQRNGLIGKGTALAKQFDRNKSAPLLWQHILGTINR